MKGRVEKSRGAQCRGRCQIDRLARRRGQPEKGIHVMTHPTLSPERWLSRRYYTIRPIAGYVVSALAAELRTDAYETSRWLRTEVVHREAEGLCSERPGILVGVCRLIEKPSMTNFDHSSRNAWLL